MRYDLVFWGFLAVACLIAGFIGLVMLPLEMKTLGVLNLVFGAGLSFIAVSEAHK